MRIFCAAQTPRFPNSVLAHHNRNSVTNDESTSDGTLPLSQSIMLSHAMSTSWLVLSEHDVQPPSGSALLARRPYRFGPSHVLHAKATRSPAGSAAVFSASSLRTTFQGILAPIVVNSQPVLLQRRQHHPERLLFARLLHALLNRSR
jgi:hypothetical protein